MRERGKTCFNGESSVARTGRKHTAGTQLLPSHLVLFGLVADVMDELLHPLGCRASPLGPGIWAERLVSRLRREKWISNSGKGRAINTELKLTSAFSIRVSAQNS